MSQCLQPPACTGVSGEPVRAECVAAGDAGSTPTAQVKDELACRPLSARCCLFAEVAVMFRLAGTVRVDRGTTRLTVASDHAGAARRLAVAVATLTGQEPAVESTPGHGSAMGRWVLRVDSGAAALARKVGLCDGTGRSVTGIPQLVMVSAACCQVAAWRAAVLAAGTLPLTAGERRLRVGCPDLPAAMSLAMLAGRIAARARVPAVGPPQVMIEVATEVAAMLATIGVSEELIEAVLVPAARPRASAERLRASRYGDRTGISVVGSHPDGTGRVRAETERPRR
jgi:DNA-binding protein WhiA